MRKLTLEQYQQLQPFEIILHRALYGHYTSCTRSEFISIISIDSNNFIDYAVSKSAMNCSRCKLKELERIAKKYFEFKNEQ